MSPTDQRPRYSPASLRCSRALPGTPLASSSECGWISVLVEHHRVGVPDGEPFETVATPDQTLVVMLTGEQELAAFKGGSWRHAGYRAGTVGLTQGGQSDRLRRRPAAGSRPFEKVNLYVPQDVLGQAAEHLRRAGGRRDERPLTALAFQDRTVAQMAVALLRGMAEGQPDLYAEAAVHWLAVHLLSTCDRRAVDRTAWAGEIADRRLARVVGYMTEHAADPLGLEALAAEAGVSKFHFARLFRAALGVAPYAFLLGLRLDRAQALLTDTELSVKEVASRCGFARAAQLGAAFAKRHGVSPVAYRKAARR